MRNVAIFIPALISLLIAGCAHPELFGKERISVGTVGVNRSLDFTGGHFDDNLVVDVDENGIVILSAQKDKENIFIYLSPAAQEKLREMLKESIQQGYLADRQRMDVQKPLGHLRTKVGDYGWPTDLVMQFYTIKSGTIWNVSLEFCYMKPEEFQGSSKDKIKQCEKSMTLYLTEFSAIQLRDCLSLASDYARRRKSPEPPPAPAPQPTAPKSK